MAVKTLPWDFLEWQRTLLNVFNSILSVPNLIRFEKNI